MEKENTIKSNFLYQVLYNCVTMILPLIVTPFLTRALLENKIGEFTYSRSIASYFVLFAMLGIVKYGQRIISQNRDNETKLRKSFWSLFAVHVVFSLLALVIYFVSVSFIGANNTLYWIQGLYVLSALFDITWLYYGLENFRGVVLRNAVIKVVEALLYILLIKSPDDIYLYAFINCSAVLLSQVALLPGAIRQIKPIHVNWNECKIHVKPLMVFAVAVIGITLYTVFDTTLLGFFSTKDNVAFYDYSNRIAKIPLAVASVIGTVLFPRACKLVAQNNIGEQKKYLSFSITIVSIVGSVSFWGLLIVGEPLAKIYLGENFGTCGPIIAALSSLVYIVGIGDVVRTQLMIPNGMDRQYINSILLSAVTNLVLSTFLILNLPKDIQVYGAVIGTIAAESVGMLYQLIICRKYISIKKLIKTVNITFAVGSIMYAVLRIVTINVQWNMVSLIAVVAIGALIFIPLTLLYVFLCEKDFWRILFKR